MATGSDEAAGLQVRNGRYEALTAALSVAHAAVRGMATPNAPVVAPGGTRASIPDPETILARTQPSSTQDARDRRRSNGDGNIEAACSWPKAVSSAADAPLPRTAADPDLPSENSTAGRGEMRSSRRSCHNVHVGGKTAAHLDFLRWIQPSVLRDGDRDRRRSRPAASQASAGRVRQRRRNPPRLSGRLIPRCRGHDPPSRFVYMAPAESSGLSEARGTGTLVFMCYVVAKPDAGGVACPCLIGWMRKSCSQAGSDRPMRAPELRSPGSGAVEALRPLPRPGSTARLARAFIAKAVFDAPDGAHRALRLRSLPACGAVPAGFRRAAGLRVSGRSRLETLCSDEMAIRARPCIEAAQEPAGWRQTDAEPSAGWRPAGCRASATPRAITSGSRHVAPMAGCPISCS